MAIPENIPDSPTVTTGILKTMLPNIQMFPEHLINIFY